MIARLFRTEPAILRGLLIGITAVAAAILGRKVDTEWVDTVVGLYVLAAPLIAGALIRSKVASMARLNDLGIEVPAGGRHARREVPE